MPRTAARDILEVVRQRELARDGAAHGLAPAGCASVPVAAQIAAAEMTAGRKVAVALFDPTNPADAVVFAVWT